MRQAGHHDDLGPTCEEAGKACEVAGQGLMLGGKGRAALPIPWVAPFLEVGVGLSAGYFVADTVAHRWKRNLLVHVPVALGLALGPGHNVEVALAMYQHFAVQQFVVPFTLSLSIPLGSSDADSEADSQAKPLRSSLRRRASSAGS